MIYKSLADCVEDLENHRHLVRITENISPHLVMAAVQRRVYRAGGPAILFTNIDGSPFPAVSNLFGTLPRARFIFRHRLELVKRAVELKGNPEKAWKQPWRYWRVPFAAIGALPWHRRRGPVTFYKTSIDKLPQIKCWPDDGGPFITLPQVLTVHPDSTSVMHSNLGMYRIQMAGNSYLTNEQVGMHYQIHRGIGPHHAAALAKGQKLSVSIFVGGPPAHTLAAVMPLPEGLSELTFAGMLAGRRFRYGYHEQKLISWDADFCITGTIDPTLTLPEGPFGDHLGYYSLKHNFPVMKVETVFHRQGAIWPFTVVGRPPQEDTTFGELIHDITGAAVSSELPGVHALHAVDAAGVHPLLLAIGSERYVPYASERVPQEILTQANAILGFGQCSLAKYLFITAHEDDPRLDIHNVQSVFQHVLKRIDLRRDLHFQTKTTIDTLDYSGSGLNQGSKVVFAAAGNPKRELQNQIPLDVRWPDSWTKPRVVMPGVIAMTAPRFTSYELECELVTNHIKSIEGDTTAFPLVVLCDDSDFCSASISNFLWVTFTRSNPSHDLFGRFEEFRHKHWGCQQSLIIDARVKPHHAPPLEEDDQAETLAEAIIRKYPQLLP